MAKPRIFISSTFYDLRQVREDLERSIRELGYEPVRHETGAIPYSKDEAPEVSAYREVDICDVIVCVIGGRFGTESRQDSAHSITQMELKRALERGIQVFVFIDSDVLSEFATYRINKRTKKIKYNAVNDVRVYKFIEALYDLPHNNAICPFQTGKDIAEFLRAQFAGLFQRFLREQKRVSEVKVLDEMKQVAATLQQLVDFLTKERANKDTAIKSILLANHPAFRRFAELTNSPYRVFFTDRKELEAWIRARSWKMVPKANMDKGSVAEWSAGKLYIKLTHNIFEEDGRLKVFSENEWRDEWLQKLPWAPEEAASE